MPHYQSRQDRNRPKHKEEDVQNDNGVSEDVTGSVSGDSSSSSGSSSSSDDHDHADMCSQCANVCTKTAWYYMTVEDHDHDLLKHLLICAEVCKLCATSLSLCSPNCCDIMELCAKVCADCAKSCSLHPDDECIFKCASTCNDCSECCSGGTNDDSCDGSTDVVE